MFELSSADKERVNNLREIRDNDEYRPDNDRAEDYLIDDIITEEIEIDMY